MSDTETRRGFEKIQLNNNNLVFADIMSNGKKYIVPRFQRDYSWNVEQWDELWRDIEDMRKNRSQHFMGYLVFQENMEAAFRVFHVIDGQQRLTTLSLIIVAVLNRLRELVNNTVEAEDNISRIDMYQKSYLGVTDPSTPRIKDPKLRLNRHNDQTFRILAERLEALSEQNMMATNVLIHETFEFFRKKLKHYQSGAELAAMVNDISQGLLFTTITVTDDLSAYAMFETLNARGVSLSTPDLLKNYLLSTMVSADSYSEDELEDIEEHWAHILKQLGETEFNNFLRSYRGLRDKLVPKKELFRTLKKDISLPQDVQPYLYDLQKYAPVYAALQNHQDTFWNRQEGKYRDVCPHLELLKLFNVKTPLTILMAGYMKLSAPDFIKLARCIAVVTIRYNVILHNHPNVQEATYNGMAHTLMNNTATVNDLIKMLEPVYPDNKNFAENFAVLDMPGRAAGKRIRFLLRKIEAQLSEGQEPPETLTVEHVLPFTPSPQWQKYFGIDNYAQATARLGNMALVKNSDRMGQESFQEKRKVLEASGYKINAHIAEYAEWDMDALAKHQQWLERKAQVVWKISQLEKEAL